MIRVRLVAAVSIAALAVAAIPASALTHEFVASKTGKTASTGKTQEFRLPTGSPVACGEVTGTGEVTKGTPKTRKEMLTYSKCEWEGYPEVTIEPVHFEFNAEGTAKIEKSFDITPLGAGCHFTILAQTVEATYGNEAGKLTTKLASNKLSYKSSGGECGNEANPGSLSGERIRTLLEGGTLEWK